LSKNHTNTSAVGTTFRNHFSLRKERTQNWLQRLSRINY